MAYRKNFIINFIYYGIIIGVSYVVLRFSAKYLTPFIFGFLIAFILNPIIRKIQQGLHTKNKLIAILVILLFYAILGFALTFLGIKLSAAIAGIFRNLPAFYANSIQPGMEHLIDQITTSLEHIDPAIEATILPIIAQSGDKLSGLVTDFSAWAVGMATSYITMIPNFLVTSIIGIIASIFFSVDYQKIVNFFARYVPERPRQIIFDVKEILFRVIFKYLKSYAILMTLTFVELSIGLSILRVNNAIGLAALIALIDILPVLGTGGVVIPWIIIELINQQFPLAIGLTIVYVIITVIRNIIEPKIVGDQIGLHPLITLILIYVGAKLFGMLGLFGLPIAAAILKALHDSGKIGLFRKFDQRYNTQTPHEDVSQ